MSRDRLRTAFLNLLAVALAVLAVYTLAKDVHRGGLIHLTNAIAAAIELGISLWLLDNAMAIRLIDFVIDRVQRLRGKS